LVVDANRHPKVSGEQSQSAGVDALHACRARTCRADRKRWIVLNLRALNCYISVLTRHFHLLYSRPSKRLLAVRSRTRRPWRGGVMTRVLSLCSKAALLIVLAATHARAQGGATAQITGTVKDPSGGVLPGADVTVTQTDTSFKRSAVTNADGAFNFPNLPVG